MYTRIIFLLCGLSWLSLAMLPAQLQNPKQLPFEWDTDTTLRQVPLSEIQMVLPRKSFPTIDYPAFLERTAGLAAFYKHEPVIAVAINGQAKAYPLNILTMHEMTNDTLAGMPILPTYCPLCNASVVYDRRLPYQGDTLILTFEVSGMLRHSDMVMADAQTQTWWQQLTGEGIVGDLSGVQLPILSSLVISVEEFFSRYPDGQILSPENETKAASRYGLNPYVSYDSLGNTPFGKYFDLEQLDDRLPAMERVIDVASPQGYRIYPLSTIRKAKVINDTFAGKPLVIFHQGRTVSVLDRREVANSRVVGSTTVFSPVIAAQRLTFIKKRGQFYDQQTNSQWDITGYCSKGILKGKQLRPVRHGHHFAFAWLQFHPESEIYGGK